MLNKTYDWPGFLKFSMGNWYFFLSLMQLYVFIQITRYCYYTFIFQGCTAFNDLPLRMFIVSLYKLDFKFRISRNVLRCFELNSTFFFSDVNIISAFAVSLSMFFTLVTSWWSLSESKPALFISPANHEVSKVMVVIISIQLFFRSCESPLVGWAAACSGAVAENSS